MASNSKVGLVSFYNFSESKILSQGSFVLISMLLTQGNYSISSFEEYLFSYYLSVDTYNCKKLIRICFRNYDIFHAQCAIANLKLSSPFKGSYSARPHFALRLAQWRPRSRGEGREVDLPIAPASEPPPHTTSRPPVVSEGRGCPHQLL